MSEEFAEKILMVDDDANLLAAIKRQFYRKYNMVFANSGREGLEVLKAEGPIALVVSDMRMPEMEGVEFLARVNEASPDTVRIMLTGNADLDTAVHAVNISNIYRFLLKPCDKETLDNAIQTGLRQHRLITAEKELLEKTLNGFVKVLSDILALINPIAFSRASRVREYVTKIAAQFGKEGIWQYQMAASLSQLGCVAVPPDTLAKIHVRSELTEDEKQMFDSHPELGRQLLENIPRIESVASAIGNQNRPLSEFTKEDLNLVGREGVFGAMLLKIVSDFDTLAMGGLDKDEILRRMRKQAGHLYNAKLLEAMKNVDIINPTIDCRKVALIELTDTMVLAEDVYTESGIFLAAKGQEVTRSMIIKLLNYSRRGEIPQEILVSSTLCPTNEPMIAPEKEAPTEPVEN